MITMTTFTFRVTDDHMAEGLARFRTAKRIPVFLWPVTALCFLGLGILLVICVARGLWAPASMLAPFPVVLAVAPWLDRFVLKRRLPKSSFYLSDVQIAVPEQGFLSVDKKSRVEMKWSVFSEVVRFKNGIHLLIGNQQFYGWPDTAPIKGGAT